MLRAEDSVIALIDVQGKLAELMFEKLLTLGWLDPEPGASR